MNLKKLIAALTELSAKYPDAIVYFGHKDGSGCTDRDCRYLIGEYVDKELVNHRAFCIGEHMEITQDLDDDDIIDFDAI